MRNNLYCVKCWVHIFSGLFDSSGSPVHVRTRNNLYCVKCCIHIFIGSSGSAVDQRTWNNCYACNSRVIYFAEISSQILYHYQFIQSLIMKLQQP